MLYYESAWQMDLLNYQPLGPVYLSWLIFIDAEDAVA